MNNLERIESYLALEMSGNELRTFEADLSRDRELQREFALVRAVDDTIGDSEVLDLRNGLMAFMRDRRSTSAGNLRIRKLMPALAAAAAVIILLGSALLIFNRGYDAEDAFADMYETYPSLYNTRSAGVTVDEVVSAMEPYDIGDFETADANLAALLERDPSRMDLVFYRGICQVELQKYSQAVVFFGEVLESDLVLMHEQSIWYRSLAFLAMGEEEQALDGLEELVREGSSYSEKSQRVISKLR